jgi:hypothetical protein
MMARFRIKNVKSVLNGIKAGFEKSFEKKGIYQSIGIFTGQRVREETSKGKDLTREGAKQPELQQSSIDLRELIKKGKVLIDPPQGRFFRFNRSNLTMTGQLLDSVNAKVNLKDKEVVISAEGSRDEVTYTLAETGDEIEFFEDGDVFETNESLVKDLAKRGRTFLGIDTKGVKRIRRIVLDEVRRVIRKL